MTHNLVTLSGILDTIANSSSAQQMPNGDLVVVPERVNAPEYTLRTHESEVLIFSEAEDPSSLFSEEDVEGVRKYSFNPNFIEDYFDEEETLTHLVSLLESTVIKEETIERVIPILAGMGKSIHWLLIKMEEMDIDELEALANTFIPFELVQLFS